MELRYLPLGFSLACFGTFVALLADWTMPAASHARSRKILIGLAVGWLALLCSAEIWLALVIHNLRFRFGFPVMI